MTQLASLAWKEWHEVRWFFIIAFGLFIGMPLLGGLEGKLLDRSTHFYFDAAPWVLTLGGVLALIVAVGIVCQDLGGRREDFLRSRPLHLVRWMSVKYVIGLAAVLATCMLALALDLKTNNVKWWTQTDVALLWYPFFWTALYSLAFLCASLVRRVAHAIMLGVAAMLLLYFLPVVLPFLQHFSIDWVMDRSLELGHQHMYGYTSADVVPLQRRVEARQFIFVAGMVVVSALALATSLLAIARDWRIESGTKMMYWSMGSTLVILFASASFRLATNLPILQQTDVDQKEYVLDIRVEGTSGIMLTRSHANRSAPSVRSLRVTDAGLQFGPPVLFSRVWHDYWKESVGWSSRNPDLLYLSETILWPDGSAEFELRTLSLTSGNDIAPPLWLWDKGYYDRDIGRPLLILLQDKIYAIGGSLLGVIDISKPAEPKLVSVEDFHRGHWPENHSRLEHFVGLPLLPGVPDRERLEAAYRFSYGGESLSGDVLCKEWNDSLDLYKLDRLTDQNAHFTEVGRYETSMLEKVFGETSGRQIKALGDLAYVTNDTRNGITTVSTPRITVFDIREPRHPHPVGHFSVPSRRFFVMCPLADGRAIIAGDKIYLVGKPPVRE
jgi:hypothetical protein